MSVSDEETKFNNDDLLAAYAFAFYIIHPHAVVFDNPLTSFLKVFVMMTGEYDLEKYFIWESVKEEPML